jgi:C-terminal processing protease CtpA/Prc
VRLARIFRLFRGVRLPAPWAIAAATLALAACAPQRGTIGAVLGQRKDGRLFVREVPEGLAAARSGLSPGDEILLVDGKDVRSLPEGELHRVLSGDVGGRVKLTIARGDAALRLTLVRTPAPTTRPAASSRQPP